MGNSYFNFYDVLSLFGAFLALLLGCIFAFNEKFRTKSNLAIAIGLFSASLTVSRNVFVNLIEIQELELIYNLPLCHISLIPLGFYYNILYLLNPTYPFQKKDYWLTAPFLLTLVVDLIFLFLFLFNKDLLELNPHWLSWYGNIFINLLVVVYFFITLPISWKRLNDYQARLLDNYSYIEGKDLEWQRNSIVIIFIIIFVFIALRVSLIFFPDYVEFFFYLFLLLISGFICLAAFRIIIHQNFYLVPHFKEKATMVETQSTLSEKTEDHYQRLLQIMQEEKLYQNPELNMDMLAEKIQLSKSYLSRIINQKEGKNFYNFVNTFRVEEVKKNLNHPDFAHYSILGIGMAAGFKSKSTFNTIFKKKTGMTPSAYKKSKNS